MLRIARDSNTVKYIDKRNGKKYLQCSLKCGNIHIVAEYDGYNLMDIWTFSSVG